jgi:hypothetical protein
MQTRAATVADYLASLPEDRRAAINAVRQVILANLDSEYEEGIVYGMIGYYVPHRIYPAGYHCDPKQPLLFAALAAQKNYLSLYLMCIYDSCDGANAGWFRDECAKTGKRLDMGKSCIRFRKPDDLPLDLIGRAVKRVPARAYIRTCEAALARRGGSAPAKKKSGAARAGKSK